MRTRNLKLDPGSYNETDNTIEVVVATEAPMRCMDWGGITWDEILLCRDDAVDLARLNSGAPFLNAHNAWNLSAILGVVVPGSARTENGQLLARIQLSSADVDKAIVDKIKAGLIRNISVGYNVSRWLVDKNGPIEIRSAERWEPLEVSAVPVQADKQAQVRSEKNMGTETEGTGTAEVSGNVVDIQRARDARSLGILQAARKLGLPSEQAEVLIANEAVTLDGARAAMIDTVAERADAAGITSGTRVVAGADATDAFVDGVTEAFARRAFPRGFKGEPSEKARPYMRLGCADLARECLEQRGVSTRGMGRIDTIDAALRYRSLGAMSGADLSNVLGNVQSKILIKAYAEAPALWREICLEVPLADFKTARAVLMSGLPNLQEKLTGGEFKTVSLADTGESYGLGTKGLVIRFTRQMVINDDLNALARIPIIVGRSVARTRNHMVFALLASNPEMEDGELVFSAAHANLQASGAPPDADEVVAMWAMMKEQRGFGADGTDDDQKLDLAPHCWVGSTTTGPALDLLLNPLGRLVPIEVANVVPGVVEGRHVITTAYLAGKPWYAIGNPQDVDFIHACNLQGAEGPQTEVLAPQEFDGSATKVWDDFGCKIVDFRGAVRNDGE